jgi:hypothetical protein
MYKCKRRGKQENLNKGQAQEEVRSSRIRVFPYLHNPLFLIRVVCSIIRYLSAILIIGIETTSIIDLEIEIMQLPMPQQPAVGATASEQQQSHHQVDQVSTKLESKNKCKNLAVH